MTNVKRRRTVSIVGILHHSDREQYTLGQLSHTCTIECILSCTHSVLTHSMPVMFLKTWSTTILNQWSLSSSPSLWVWKLLLRKQTSVPTVRLVDDSFCVLLRVGGKFSKLLPLCMNRYFLLKKCSTVAMADSLLSVCMS